MHASAPPQTSPTTLHRLREPIVLGTLCGLCSAIGYTAANACLRAVADCDPVWVSCAKAFPTVALVGPFLLAHLVGGRERFPSWRQMRALIIAALVCQLFGNVVFQWSLGVIGMALAVPLTLGAMIIGSAIMGRLFLHEPVTVAMACSLAILIAAVFVLSFGARQVAEPMGQHGADEREGQEPPTASTVNDDPAKRASLRETPPRTGLVLAGVGAACLSGLAYALLGVVIRFVVTDSTSVSMTMVTVTLTGVIALGAMGIVTPGLGVMLETSRVDFSIMMLAGVFNAIAFLALTKALQLVPVAQVNALNASQAAMGAIAGVAIFAEPSSWQLWLGVGMTAVGLLLMRRPKQRRPKQRRGNKKNREAD